MLRLIKAALVAAVGLHALFYVMENIANIEQAHFALAYVFSGADHEVYPNHIFPPLTNPVFAWIALGVVLLGESATAIFGLLGGWHLFKARNASAAEFHSAKRAGIIAGSLALLTWFGLFMTFGAAYFAMWQTELGTGSMEGAFMYAMASAITILFVCLTPDD